MRADKSADTNRCFNVATHRVYINGQAWRGRCLGEKLAKADIVAGLYPSNGVDAIEAAE